MDLQIDGDAVINKMQLLYPTQFAHAVAECKVDALMGKLQESESPNGQSE